MIACPNPWGVRGARRWRILWGRSWGSSGSWSFLYSKISKLPAIDDLHNNFLLQTSYTVTFLKSACRSLYFKSGNPFPAWPWDVWQVRQRKLSGFPTPPPIKWWERRRMIRGWWRRRPRRWPWAVSEVDLKNSWGLNGKENLIKAQKIGHLHHSICVQALGGYVIGLAVPKVPNHQIDYILLVWSGTQLSGWSVSPPHLFCQVSRPSLVLNSSNGECDSQCCFCRLNQCFWSGKQIWGDRWNLNKDRQHSQRFNFGFWTEPLQHVSRHCSALLRLHFRGTVLAGEEVAVVSRTL